jgi:hypothetical protein
MVCGSEVVVTQNCGRTEMMIGQIKIPGRERKLLSTVKFDR